MTRSISGVAKVQEPLSAPTLDAPPTLDATALFNGYIGASLAYSYDQLGIFAILRRSETSSLEEIIASTGGHENRVRALLKAGVTLGYVRAAEGRYALTADGNEVARHAGYFTWGVGGYGKFFRELSALAVGNSGWSHLRDGSMVALGSDQANASFMQEKLYSTLAGIKFTRIADLGCGNAGRLIEICRRNPGVNGVGIDINADAVTLARGNVAQHGMSERIELHCQNVLRAVTDASHSEAFRDVEVVTCFMMLHDLFSVEGMKDVLFARLRAAFPNVKYFVIADTVQMPGRDELSELPIFNIGFELLHAFMEVQIFPKKVYDDAFVKAGLEIAECIEFGTPNTYLYLLRV